MSLRSQLARIKSTRNKHESEHLSFVADDLDYMHARYFNQRVGRFLSFGPLHQYKPTRLPQTWNRYVYGLGDPMKFLDPDGLAVQSFALLTQGENTVSVPGYPETLGLEHVPSGFHLNLNVQIDFDPGDDLGTYTVERDALTLSPFSVFRTGRDENPDDPRHIARMGSTMYVYDGPGILAQQGDMLLPKAKMGSGNYVAYFQIRVLDTHTKTMDPKRYYFAIAVRYENGEAVEFHTKEVTEEEYRRRLEDSKE